ncbi:MAG: hypothetical protein KKB62_03795, partial [Nanoarchaeota archaeon]|nr:hypothetical protein [Nanoarchaeota archaeon]
RKRIIPVLILIILVVGGVIFFSFSNQKTSGHLIVNLAGELVDGELNNGKINLVLSEGELIPEGSLLVIENNGISYTYNLSDLLEPEEVLSGNFYIEGSSISGSGEGYGLEGSRIIYPTVSFELELAGEDGNETQTPPDGEESEEQNETEFQTNETSEMDENETIVVPENETSEEEIPEEFSEEEIPEENSSESNAPIVVPENETSEEEIPEEFSEEEIPEENSSESNAPITGSAVSGLFGYLPSFLSGFATSERLKISGTVSRGNDFVYNTNLDWRVVPGSVSSNGEVIPEGEISIEKIETTLITGIVVSTNYFVEETGFGKDYLGKETKTFSIDLEKINLTLVEGSLMVSLVHESDIAVYEISYDSLDKTNITDINQTIISLPEFLNVSLTDSERAIILLMLNQSQVEANALTYRDKYLITFKIGPYSAEYSYPRSLEEDRIFLYLERDKTLWLKDIARKLRERPPLIGTAENFNANYSL